MQSTPESKDILQINNLNLYFELDFHYIENLREKFIQAITHPIDFLSPQTENLHVLKDVNLTIQRGDRIGIIGVNGAGKTSLCRCIAGMYTPNTGTVISHGDVRAIFDTTVGIIPELTGRENALLLSKFIFPNISSAQREDIVRDALEFSELGHFLDTPFRTYSKGMQSRLCLSLISAMSTDLLILDEVFDGADEFFQAKIAKRVLNMIHRSGAVIFVSHSPTQIKQACNRAIVLNEGSIAFDGSPDEAISFYKNLDLKSS